MNQLPTVLETANLDENKGPLALLIGGGVPATARCLLTLAEGGLL